MGYWNWWYQRNKKYLQVIGYVFIGIAMMGLVALVLYAVIKFNEYLEQQMELLKQSNEYVSVNPLPILVLIFLSCIILICFVSYREYRKENIDEG